MELIISLALGLSIWLLYPADSPSVTERSRGRGGADFGSESGEGLVDAGRAAAGDSSWGGPATMQGSPDIES